MTFFFFLSIPFPQYFFSAICQLFFPYRIRWFFFRIRTIRYPCFSHGLLFIRITVMRYFNVLFFCYCVKASDRVQAAQVRGDRVAQHHPRHTLLWLLQGAQSLLLDTRLRHHHPPPHHKQPPLPQEAQFHRTKYPTTTYLFVLILFSKENKINICKKKKKKKRIHRTQQHERPQGLLHVPGYVFALLNCSRTKKKSSHSSHPSHTKQSQQRQQQQQ
jgi:hypothetical protein